MTVVNGTGGGAYAVGTAVAVTADAAPDGQVFAHWAVEPADADRGASFDAGSASTTLTMPEHDVTLRANYESQLGEAGDYLRRQRRQGQPLRMEFRSGD